jgi:NADH dehydrogenase
MNNGDLVAVTGAFGYTGKYITRLLLARGDRVITLTAHPERPNEFGGQVQAYPFDFDRPERLCQNLRGVKTLYNTYWVRFDYGSATFDRAIENTQILFRAALQAGVQRVVHVSITNPVLESPLPYFRGKAVLEQALRHSGLSYAILRPTVLFGPEDILINNIAYLVRRFPFFAVPGSGDYRLQPVFVEDMAELCVQAAGSGENLLLDAVGPDILTFDELVRLIASKINRRVKILHFPPALALLLSRLVGLWLGDVVLTPDELAGLSAGLLVSSASPTCSTRLADWLELNAAQVGSRYASEIARHYKNSSVKSLANPG